MSDPNAKDNLARIRDNQRRSRARRKEYLQELESKYRTCQQLGVQASAEIQAAAKRVLDENRRLRALLRHKGVSDAEIDSFTDTDSPSASHSSDALETMLSTRRPCKPQSGCGTGSGCSSKSPAQQPPAAMPQLDTNPAPSVPTPLSQMSPQAYVSAVSMTSALNAPTASASPMSAEPPVQHHLSPAVPAITTSAYDPTYATYYGASMHSSWAWPGAIDMSMISAPQAPNTSSCVHAASIIREMRNDLGPELEQDLGCSGPDQDCKVDNNVVFELVDKYSMRGL
ncbi:hypothetical protein MPH_09441 [Macrophomina phaseolina MS6]|uniref:BZIP domain-containing protein n=1 Tax=Macrophomina phaseolina (strain MS6) TaxID=1126212 RepID=K2S967_MACPH|nr:hypothetical protein MPH_09441 [Macrophomina phaseolina MS6]